MVQDLLLNSQRHLQLLPANTHVCRPAAGATLFIDKIKHFLVIITSA